LGVGLHQDGQPDDELASVTDTGALHRDAAAVHLDQGLDERQPDAQPGQGPIERRVHLREHVEYALELIGGDADPRIPNADDDPCGFLLALNDQPDVTATLRELASVVQEIADDLAQPGRVRIQVY